MSGFKTTQKFTNQSPDGPTVRPVSLQPTAQERRGLRRREILILGLLAVMMIGAWVVTLKI